MSANPHTSPLAVALFEAFARNGGNRPNDHFDRNAAEQWMQQALDECLPKPAAAQEAVAWSKMKPTTEGDYYVRGFNLFAPKQYEALVQVRMHHFDGEPAPELVCNLHESTSSDDMDDWSPIVEMSDDFEWMGPLFAAPVTAAPAGVTRDDAEQVIDRIMGEYGFSMPSRAYAELVDEFMCAPAAPGIDLQSFRRAAMPILCPMLCARDAESVVRKLHAALIDASPKGTLNEQFGSAEGLSAPEDDGLAVRRVADHMAQVIDYIDKRYPDAAMLDRGPILRNIRQWEKRLRAVLVGSPKGGSEARQPSAWISDNDLLKLRDSIDDARNIRMSSERTHLRVHPVFIPAMQAGDAEVQP